jgi:hypothetical protein
VQPQPELERDAHRLFLDLLKRGAAIRAQARQARARARETSERSKDLGGVTQPRRELGH